MPLTKNSLFFQLEDMFPFSSQRTGKINAVTSSIHTPGIPKHINPKLAINVITLFIQKNLHKVLLEKFKIFFQTRGLL